MSKKKASSKTKDKRAAATKAPAAKSGGASKSAPPAKRPSAPKAASMPTRTTSAPAARAQREIEEAKYTPTPIEGMGWKPFRYPPA
jgi:hypothetical protein